MIAYDRLSQIIPPDQALANKALSVALSQISNIKDTSLPGLASAYKNTASVKNLDQLSNLTTPLPPSVQSYFDSNYKVGSGAGNTLVITDVIGTAAGVGFTDQFATTTEIILSLQADGTLTVLSGIYGDIANSVNGVYGDALVGPVTIPSGPAAGQYSASFDMGGNIEVSAAQTAVSGIGGPATGIGCIPAANTAITNIIAANTSATNSLNSAFDSMAQSIISENDFLNSADIDLVAIPAGSSKYSSTFIQNLFSYALDVEANGPAQYIESIANLTDIGGQALVATMRQARNNTVLNTVNIVPNNTVDQLIAPGTEVANLLPSTYTTQQAANLIVK
jgi:hypothetical protein